jgi:hypothetical protein
MARYNNWLLIGICTAGIFNRPASSAVLATQAAQAGGDTRITHIYKPNLGDGKTDELDYEPFSLTAPSFLSLQAPVASLPCTNPQAIKMPYFLITNAESGLPGTSDFSATEAALVDKAANFWNNSGAAVHLYNGGKWSSSYHMVKGFYGEFMYPAAVHKVTSPVSISGTRVFPKTGELGITQYIIKQKSGVGVFQQWEIFLDFTGQTLSGSKVVLAFDPADFNEGYNNDLFESPRVFRTSFTTIAIHEFGHALGLNHDNFVYNTRDLAGFDFNRAFDLAFSGAIQIQTSGSSCNTRIAEGFSLASRPKFYHRSAGGVVYKATWDPQLVKSPSASACGLTGGEKTVGGHKWEIDAVSLDDASTYYWPLNPMFTEDDKEVGLPVIKSRFQSYQLVGNAELLNPVGCGSAPPSRRNYSPGYDQIHKVYTYQPSTGDNPEIPPMGRTGK